MPRKPLHICELLHRRESGLLDASDCRMAAIGNSFADKLLVHDNVIKTVPCIDDRCRSSYMAVTNPTGIAAMTHSNRCISIINTGTMKRIAEINGLKRTVWTLCFHPKKPKLLATGDLGGTVLVFYGTEQIKSRLNESSPITSISFHDIEPLIFYSIENRMVIWNYETDVKLIELCAMEESRVKYVKYNPTNDMLITGIRQENKPFNFSITDEPDENHETRLISCSAFLDHLLRCLSSIIDNMDPNSFLSIGNCWSHVHTQTDDFYKALMLYEQVQLRPTRFIGDFNTSLSLMQDRIYRIARIIFASPNFSNEGYFDDDSMAVNPRIEQIKHTINALEIIVDMYQCEVMHYNWDWHVEFGTLSDILITIHRILSIDNITEVIRGNADFRADFCQYRLQAWDMTHISGLKDRNVDERCLPEFSQIDALGRTQITALPSRTMAQTSITVTRPLTPNTFMPRGVTTNIAGSRGTIRAQTPPSVANISSGFVRGTIPPRTPSPAGTVIPTATTWMTGSQPVQLIRANIGQPPRTKFTAVSSANTGITTLVSSQSATNTIQNVSQQQANQNVSGASATLATVLPPRHQTATLVYSNPGQLGTNVTGPRLAVANPIATQRQPRPIQISSARLPTTGLSRTGSISIRGPVLTQSNVLTTLPSGTSSTVSASNLTVANLPAARIIQVQQPSPSGQVLGAGRITAMTLHPLVVNAANVSTANTVRGVSATTAKPSLTITHVGKNSQNSVQLSTANLPQGATLTASVPSSTSVVQHQSQASHSVANSQTPIGIVMGTNNAQAVPASQIAQIVNLNQSGINVGHGHQIQIIGSQGTQQTSTVVPLTITSRATHTSLSGTSVTTLPASVATNLSQIVRSGVNIVTSTNSNNTTTVLPVAKVLPQQQGISSDPLPIVSAGNVVNVVSGISRVSGGSIAVSSTAVLQSISTNSPSITTNVSSSNTAITASYAPQAGSFAVVPSSNRNVANNTSSVLTTSAVVQGGSQPIPVRFNPQLIVDGNKDNASYEGIIQKQLGHQQISYITMPPNQAIQQKSAHIIPTVGGKPGSVTVTTSTPRVTTMVTTLPRKREHDFRGEVVQQLQQASQRAPSPVSRPGSSDGSTTVSATSSPGIDQQEQEELNAIYQHQQNLQIGVTQSLQSHQQQQQQLSQQSVPQTAHSVNMSNGSDDLTPRKRPRKQQFGEYGQPGVKKFHIELDTSMQLEQTVVSTAPSHQAASYPSVDTSQPNTSADAANQTVKINNENTPPKIVDYFIKRPKACNLLDSYKQTWKSTQNHFQRYSDVKPREERTTVVDLANQAHVLQKVNGWKIYHLTSQMEILSEVESEVYDKLASMLQCMEAHEQNTDVDRVNELIKGNMQRSKIVSDSINEARVQILKVFDHKSHVSEIIHRCASKRNAKKREKS